MSPADDAALDTAMAAQKTRDREPRGYAPLFSLAMFGLFLAVFGPIFGGLSVRIQSLVGLADAARDLGLVTGAGALIALVAQPFAGWISDRTTGRWGMRRPWIVIGSVGAFAGLCGIGLAGSVPMLLIGWCVVQLFANIAQAATTATIADQVPESRRGAVSSMLGVVGPVAILVAAIGLRALPGTVLASVVPGAIALLFGIVFAVTVHDRALEAPRPVGGLGSLLGSLFINPRRYPDLGWAWVTKAMIMFGYAATTSFLTLFLATAFGVTDLGLQLTWNLGATGVCTIVMIAFAIVSGRMSDRSGRRREFVAAGGVLVAIGLVVMAIAPLMGDAGLIAVIAGEAVIGAGVGLFYGVDMALCIAILPSAQDTAKHLGFLNIATALPQMVAPFVAGVIVLPLVSAVLPQFAYTVWFLIAAVVALVGGLLVYRIRGAR